MTLAQSYDPFGGLFEAAGSGVSEFGYTGEQVDAGTELLFLRARNYDPVVGRFLTKDHYRGLAIRSQSLNGYTYVENNPNAWTDPSGYCPITQEGGSWSAADPITEQIVSVLQSGWDLVSNLHPGGFYGAGTVSFGSNSLDIWVEPLTFRPHPTCPGFGSFTNANVDILYETVLWISGMTNLAGWMDNAAARFAGASSPTLTADLGAPAQRLQYQFLQVDPDGSARYEGPSSSQDTALNGSTPPLLLYGQLIRDATPEYPEAPFRNVIHNIGPQRYSPEGLLTVMPSRGGQFTAGAVNAAKFTADLLQGGDVGLRKYQVLVQKWRPWKCYERFVGRRAVIRTYQLMNKGTDTQIRSSYLYVRPDAELWEHLGIELGGAIQETGIVYPRGTDLVEAPGYWDYLGFLPQAIP